MENRYKVSWLKAIIVCVLIIITGSIVTFNNFSERYIIVPNSVEVLDNNKRSFRFDYYKEVYPIETIIKKRIWTDNIEENKNKTDIKMDIKCFLMDRNIYAGNSNICRILREIANEWDD